MELEIKQVVTVVDVLCAGACYEGVVEWVIKNGMQIAVDVAKNCDNKWIAKAANINGDGDGDGDGNGNGYGDGDGNSYGNGYGNGYGYGNSYGDGDGDGDGYGNGYGDGT